MPPEQQSNVVIPTVAPAEQAAAAAELKALAAQPGWLAKATAVGANTPESNQYVELLAKKSGLSRADWDRVKLGEAKASEIQPLPKAAEVPLRTQVDPGAPPAPQEIEASEAALADFYAQQVPAHAGAYPDLVVPGAPPIPTAEQTVWKEVAYKEGYAPTEAQELAIALVNAAQGKANPAATARLRKLSVPEHQRLEEFAAAETRRLSAYPMLADTLDRLSKSKSNIDGLFEVLARRGARQASRRK